MFAMPEWKMWVYNMDIYIYTQNNGSQIYVLEL